MRNTYFNADDAQSAREAEFFCTIGGRRYTMLNAKNFEANSNISLADIKSLGSLITQKKPNGLEVKLSFTVYKCSPMFDDIVEEYKNTGRLPRFDCQVTQEDRLCTGKFHRRRPQDHGRTSGNSWKHYQKFLPGRYQYYHEPIQ